MATTGAFAQALGILETACLDEKVKLTHAMSVDWASDKTLGAVVQTLPDVPARPPTPVLVSPKELPRRRLGSVAGRCALLHAVAHIEFNAIGLAADMICRFGGDPIIPEHRRTEFVNDWIKVADDEARHFGLIRARLKNLGHDYGDHPAHNGLWEAAVATKGNLCARLAIAPLVLEARGLDVTPAMIKKFKHVQDYESADILTVIYNDEITHVATGSKWFHIVAEHQKTDPSIQFRNLVKTYFKGDLKPPFNHPARTEAGLPKHYYT